MTRAFIGIGANLGDRPATILAAVDRLGDSGEVIAVSSIYETAPVGYTEQPAFLNAAVEIETPLSAADLLAALLAIEREHGRQRTFPNAPRTLDLDLLLYGEAIIEQPWLAVPHPRLHERAFVLVPLAEIAPEVRHPVFEKTVEEMLGHLGTLEGIERFAPS